VRDLRTLTATGASSTTRRTLTGATVGALALLGALIGATGAYLAPYRLVPPHNLHWLSYVPITDLTGILAGVPASRRPGVPASRRPGVPATATVAGWLLAGREPPAITRQPLE